MKKKYQGTTWVKRQQLQALRNEFEILQMKQGESVDEYFSRTLTIVNKMRVHREKIEDVAVVEKILRSVDSKFSYVLQEKGYVTTIKDGVCEIYDPRRGLIARVEMATNRLFPLKLEGFELCFKTSVDEDPTWLWHLRYAHLNFKEDTLEQQTVHVNLEDSDESLSPQLEDLVQQSVELETTELQTGGASSSRSQRVIRRPAWMEDYEVIGDLFDEALVHYALLSEFDPLTFKEVVNDIKWKQTIDEEIKSI
ncbi:retrotransposon protein [Cucumis melo var. makuwa]|uniref:Retrotransposon protein n=1 Tax=Cucumis melo var. makuwa TaxID=1194695 RepID=A0A5A7ULM9_CUCMM|nr:retrotransposon protein [Cucumis melo var. makuwa]TYK27539.1 retrotransposon protein [Cucumis melo var. makuwa]